VTEPVRRHFERADWRRATARRRTSRRGRSPSPAVAQLVAEAGLLIPAGVTFLIGENGSGKSTIVEALAAIYPRLGLVSLLDVELVQSWRAFLEAPGRYLRHLLD
jgi:ABC-type multidrug transport system ATPase subunit